MSDEPPSEPRTRNDKIARILRDEPGRRFTAREIAEALVRRWPDWAEQKRRESRQNLDHAGLLQQLVSEVGADREALQRKYRAVRTTEERPRRYYWSELPTELPFEDEMPASKTGPAISPATSVELAASEADLYPILGRYLHGELGLWPKRIDERAASRKTAGFNRWLFPDLVAMELVTGTDWPAPVRELSRAMRADRARLWSFEVKVRLDRSNLREAFFQAVSNSSWANLGYLVAAEIAGDGTLDELRVLGGLHGIGVIRLERDDPSESEILVPARGRSEVDWASLARLAAESIDMKAFVEAVSGSLGAGQPLKHAFDYVGS